MSTGLFITFEGGEGSGKTTQLRVLASRLESLGLQVRTLREPGGTSVGEAIRRVLLDPEYVGMDATTEVLLYEAARAELVAQVIEPAMAAGEIVLCDRFFDSTTAYQGYARGLSLEMVEELNKAATGGLSPDRTLYFDIDPAVGIERATTNGADRLEGEDLAFHERVRQGFLALAAEDRQRFRVVDASGSIEEVAEKVALSLADLGSLSILGGT